MRFERIRTRGLGPYKGEVDIDLSAIEGPIVAVTGLNGSGKSTFLELLPGAIYRQCPTRGPLAGLATTRDAFAEVTVVNGARHTIRQTVDAIGGKGETLITDADGEPVVESAKVSHADVWIAEHLPSSGELYAGPFAVQGSRGFLDLKRGDRKALLLRMLGIERLERMAEQARERGRDAKAALALVRERHAAKVATAEPAQRHAAEVERLTAEVAAADELVASLENAVRRAQDAAQDVRRAAEFAAQRRAATRRLEDATTQVDGLKVKIANNRRLLERSDEVRAAQVQAVEQSAQLEAHRARRVELEQTRQSADHAEQVALQDRDRAIAQTLDAEGRAKRFERQLLDEQLVAGAVAKVESVREALASEERSVAEARAERQLLADVLLTGKDRRLTRLRDGLHAIADGGVPEVLAEPNRLADEVLCADDRFVLEAEGLPDRIKAADLEIARRVEEAARVREDLVDQKQLAARAPEMRAAREGVDDARRAIEAARPAADAASAIAKSRSEARAEAVRALREVVALIEAVKQAQSILTPALGLVTRLDQAEARIEELEGQLLALGRAITAARTELEGLPDVEAPAGVDVDAQQRRLQETQARARSLREQLGREQAGVDACAKAAQEAGALAVEVSAAEAVLADWTRLAADLGRDGLQAMEIDAAIPELNVIANALIHECHGARFTIDVRTDRLSSDGKRVLEGLDVRVLDNGRGRDALAETYSGGELVIVGEAIALALTMMACRRSGAERPTIVRDESGAALDPANARVYVAMLRKAAAALDAAHVLVVAHNPEVQALADATIHIEDGTVEALS